LLELNTIFINYRSIINPILIINILIVYSFFLLNLFSSDLTFNQQKINEITFTVIYDNYSSSEQCAGDWGFSCLIQGLEKTILFDTGTKPEIFRKNLESLSINIEDIDLIVISHNHGDHTGGLPVILEKRTDLPLYLPTSVESKFLERYKSCAETVIPVSEPLEICNGVYLSGEMDNSIKEQSLFVQTDKGLVIVTGCSHQGVDNIIMKATEISDEKIYMTFGGFHLLNHSEEQIKEILKIFLSEGVQKCGATHCTGEEATMMFKEAYGADFINLGAGRKIII